LRGNMNRDQLWSFMVGVLVFYIANSVFNIVLPAFFGITHLYYLGDYSLVFFLGFISYSILRYGLLNIKVISTELFVFTLWVFIFMRAVFANNYEERFVGFGLFVAVVVLGIFLIRGVLYEVQQREELEKLTHRLKKTNKRLKELDTMRKQFLSFASHQVKSPITVVKGYAGLIYDGTYGNVSMKIKDTAKKIVRSADTMISLVNNLLDSRRIEEGRMEFSFEKVHIGSFVRSVADDLRPLAREKGLSFVVHILLGDRVMVSADKQKFTQVLQNLIDNSIKYTERGRVEISVRLDKDKQNVVISVNDTGYGIPKDLIPQLFDQFIRGKETSSRIRGTGLGLYIAKQIVVAHKGTIRADSSGAGRGSTFVVTIPID
jgi:signal transduction histidine kinase